MLIRQIVGTASLLLITSTASASTVFVTIDNKSNEPVTLRPASQNDRNTLLHADRTLPQVLEAGRKASFSVAPYVTNDVNFASVRYHSRGRSCAFLTNYVNTYTGGGRVPRWNHSAQGGAHCASQIVRQDPYTHDWVVEFTIR
jgi:hypothetical protein